jgi:NitT/TauT family transport system substrate-binding protein
MKSLDRKNTSRAANDEAFAAVVRLTRRAAGRTMAAAIIAASFAGGAFAQADKELTVTEPVHSLGYLPLYVAVHQGFFAAEHLNIKVVTITSPAGHANAVLNDQAFACIGGPEYNAFTNSKGGDLKAVANVIDRGDVYLVAKKGTSPADKNFAAYFKGKSIAIPYYGSTPNSIVRYLVNKKWGLDLKSDVTLIELGGYPAILAALKAGQAQIGSLREPVLTQAKNEDVADDPFLSVPEELGPYTYSALSVRQKTIASDPDAVKGFVRAIAKALKFVYANPDGAVAVAKAEFPTMPAGDMKATFDRAMRDKIWSKDAVISEQSWNTAKAVVIGTDVLKTDVPYNAIIDMSFAQAGGG